MTKRITAPLSREDVRSLACGESVLLSGTIYTARDAAHLKLAELAEKGEELPLPLKDTVVYYLGPSPEKPGQVIGSAGPTSSYRMDAYAPALIALGQTGMIGKGRRGPKVVEAMKTHGAVYFGAIGGAGALLSRCITSSEVVAYPELGAEAICKLTVKDMPLTVIIDCEGRDVYEQGRERYTAYRHKRAYLKERG